MTQESQKLYTVGDAIKEVRTAKNPKGWEEVVHELRHSEEFQVLLHIAKQVAAASGIVDIVVYAAVCPVFEAGRLYERHNPLPLTQEMEK